jgi:hypothetical protein
MWESEIMTFAELELMFADRKLTVQQRVFLRAWADPQKRELMTAPIIKLAQALRAIAAQGSHQA